MKPSVALPTDRLSFQKQLEVLKAFAVGSQSGSQPVDAKKLASLTHIGEATAPLNNIFFLETGLITRAKKGLYLPTAATLEFARRVSFAAANAGDALTATFESTWFFKAVVERLAMGNATRPMMIEALARTAGADASYATQFRTLLDWLDFAGLIKIDDDENVTLVKGAGIGSAEGLRGAEWRGATPGQVTLPKSEEPTIPENVESPTVLAISVELALTVDDLAKLSAEQVGALFQGAGQVASIKAALSK